MRRPRLLVPGLLLVLLGWLLTPFAGSLAGAATDAGPAVPAATLPPGTVDLVEVVEVSGLFDPVLVDFVEHRIAEANARGLVALVLRLNSAGSVVPAED